MALSQLEFQKAIFIKSPIELSGIAKKNDSLYVVADKIHNHYIYKVGPNSPYAELHPHLNLIAMNGFYSFLLDVLLTNRGGRWLKYPLDLEGITYCGQSWYLANEQARQIIKIENNSLKILEVNWDEAFEKLKIPLKDIYVNAGFEGVAVDCQNAIMYVAQERQPRAIIAVNLNNLKVIEVFDIALAELKSKVTPDFSDLYFESNYLYILERNDHIITKLRIKDKKIISRFSFRYLKGFDLKELYDTGKPFGLAEGLAMDEQSIYITMDNNRSLISAKAKEYFGIHQEVAAILQFERPAGF